MNILITCAGRRNYLVDYFRSALNGEGKVLTVNSTFDATAMLVSDGAIIAPPLNDSEYIPFLIDVCKRFKIQLIVPLFDIELPLLAQSKEHFNKIGVEVVVSNEKAVNICNDKWQTHLFLKTHGFYTADTFIDLNSAQTSLKRKEVDFPLIVKPRWGMGSISTLAAYNLQELDTIYKMNMRGVETTYLHMQSSSNGKEQLVVQHLLDGIEYGLDVINDLEGKHVATFVKRKLAMRAGETDAAETVDYPELERLGYRLAVALGHVGNLDVDVILSKDKPYVIDLNARIGGGYPFSHLAGANLPAALIAWASDSQAKPEWFKIDPGIRGFKALQPITQDESRIIDTESCPIA